MATTKSDITRWLNAGSETGATHVIVVCDTFNYEDYPVFVTKGQDAREEYEKRHGKNMQSVMEVYDLSLDWEMQITEFRAFHF